MRLTSLWSDVLAEIVDSWEINAHPVGNLAKEDGGWYWAYDEDAEVLYQVYSPNGVYDIPSEMVRKELSE